MTFFQNPRTSSRRYTLLLLHFSSSFDLPSIPFIILRNDIRFESTTPNPLSTRFLPPPPSFSSPKLRQRSNIDPIRSYKQTPGRIQHFAYERTTCSTSACTECSQLDLTIFVVGTVPPRVEQVEIPSLLSFRISFFFLFSHSHRSIDLSLCPVYWYIRELYCKRFRCVD